MRVILSSVEAAELMQCGLSELQMLGVEEYVFVLVLQVGLWSSLRML